MRRFGLLASVMIVLSGATPHAAAAADDLAGVTCLRYGSATITPGLTTTAHDFTYLETLFTGPCTGEIGSVPTAVFTARGEGSGTCAGADVSGSFTVTWGDGSSTAGHADTVAVAPLALATGELTGGRYAGTPFQTSAVIVPEEPELCLSSGVTELGLYGEINFQ